MKTNLFLIASLLTSLHLPAMAIEAKAQTITLTEADINRCEVGGGCHVISALELAMAFEDAQRSAGQEGFQAGIKKGFELGFEAGKKAVGTKT